METIAAHTLAIQRVRDREPIGNRGMATMERGIKARDMRQFREQIRQRLQHRDRGRIMQRRERFECDDTGQRSVIHQHRRIHVRTAMHHAMPEADKRTLVERTVGQCRQLRQRVGVVFGSYRAIMHGLALGGRDKQAPVAADVFHLAADTAHRCGACHVVDGELQAGGTCVQNAQATILHCLMAFHVRSVHALADHRRAPEIRP